MKKASSIGLMQKRGGGVYSPNIEGSKQLMFGLSSKMMSYRGTTGGGENRDQSKNSSNHSANSKRGDDGDTSGGRKRTKLLTGNFFSPNLERHKLKPALFSPNLAGKDGVGSPSTKIYKLANTDAFPQSAKILNLDDCENEQPASSPKQEVWSGTCNLKNFTKPRTTTNNLLSP